MFVRIKVETNYCGEWDEGVFEFPDGTTEDAILDYASAWADENAMSFGTLDEPEDDDEEQEYRETYSEYEILPAAREEIEEEYGEIRNL